MAATTLDLNAIERGGLGTSTGSFAGLLNNIVPFVIYGAGIGLLIYLVLGGLQMMTSRGDPKAIQGAQSKITNALIGFVIVILAYSIVVVLGKALGIGPFSQVFR